MRILKKNYKFILGMVVGIIIAGTGVYATTVIASKQIDYDNNSSGLSSTNVQDAIDEVYDKTFVKKKIIAYTYNETANASNYCITGEEKTCKQNTCYESKAVGSCIQGTIIKYMVNDWTQKVFYVLHDDGTTITMQQRENTVKNIPWNSSGVNTEGPLTVIESLEAATSTWNNVNTLTYTMGTTNFYSNQYTTCSSYNSCSSNGYVWSERISKARMITVQEATSTGCVYNVVKTCPIWMYNYLNASKSYNGTVNDTATYNSSTNQGYWTMNSSTAGTSLAYRIYHSGVIDGDTDYKITQNMYGARAVVVINK